ncbi:MAG TPA: ribonuclease P protein component [Candidatus Scatavimonas merdigallinarum]|uniref:Ribonuclease P protein component n=1 Tax=Candidatus Scatavimonas merdigallinarum TaxID=2840914 RepID=A0A9D0ZJA7_9FIRM|nr:ribonuclease P protein component [Candidatus Scatavimonas merdigallinarum]
MGSMETLKENKDFKRLYNRGKSFISPVVVTYVMKNRLHSVRYGITTSKKTGKAVQRNRSRRVIRAAYAQLFPQIQAGYDFVFVARVKTSRVKSTEILRCMKKQLKEAGVLK